MKKNTLLIVGALIAVAIVAGFLYVKGKDNKNGAKVEGELPVVKLLTLQGSAEAEFLRDFTEYKGFFAKHKVTMGNVNTEKNASLMMLTGSADIYVGGIAGMLNDYLNGGDFRWIAMTTNYPYNMVGVSRFSKDEKQNIKKVAVTRISGGNHLQVIDALGKLGIDKKSVEIIEVPLASRPMMLEKGEIDFTVVDADFSGNSETYKAFQKFTLYDPSEIFSPQIAIRGITTTKKAIEENGEAIKRGLEAIDESLKYIDANPREVRKFLRDKYKYSSQNAEAFYKSYQKSREGIVYTPSGSLVTNAANIIREDFSPSNPERNVDEFVFGDFAK